MCFVKMWFLLQIDQAFGGNTMDRHIWNDAFINTCCWMLWYGPGCLCLPQHLHLFIYARLQYIGETLRAVALLDNLSFFCIHPRHMSACLPAAYGVFGTGCPMITCFSFHLVRLPQNLLLRCSNPREIQWTLVRFSEPSSDSVNPRQIQWTILVLISKLLKFLKVHITTGCPDWRISRGPTYF